MEQLSLIESRIRKSKKAQAWSLDVIIACVIFLIGVIILYVYAINYMSRSSDNLEELFYEGNLASELTLSNEDFGILTDWRVNQTKLDEFNDTYLNKKELLGVTRNFYFTLDDLELKGSPADYVGKMNSTNTENLIQITRITIYKNKPVKFQLYIWQ